jgi:glycerate kinase
VAARAKPDRYLVAPDSFKGSFGAEEVADAIGRGLRAGGAQADLCPAGDGGEGTVAALLAALGGELRAAAAHDPLGRPIEARFAMLEWTPAGGGPAAAVEVAEASGLGRVAEDERDPEAASSGGTGELIAAAVAAGARRVLVCAGGSASTDGGRGAIEAIEASGGLAGASLEVLCDTRLPFERAAAVFAPQKGADQAAVRRLGERLTALAGALPRDPRGRAMSGAAGGLAGGLWAAFGARLVPGPAFVLGLLGFDRRLEEASAVITGEGRLDRQSLTGKLTGEVARRSRAARVPCHAIAGEVALDAADAARAGFGSTLAAGTLDAIADAAKLLAAGDRTSPSRR